MKRRNLTAISLPLMLVLVLILSACGGGGGEIATSPSETEAADAGGAEETEAADAGGAEGSEQAGGAASDKRFAMLMVGPIDDADWNAKAHEALEAIGESTGMETAFSDSVPTADVERVARQYIADGYDIISLHTSAWSTVVTDLAREFPDVQFIGMNAGEDIPDRPENLWMITLQFYTGEYVMGYLGAKIAGDGGKVAYLGGIPVPSLNAGANATFAGARAANPDVGLEYTFTGDFNDTVKARQSAQALIDQGAEFVMVHLNAGVPGAVEAIRAAGDDVRWAGLYTDKRELAPEHYVGSIVYDFAEAYSKVFDEIAGGTTSGQMELDESLTELYNVDDAVAEEVRGVFEDVQSGAIDVPVKTDEVVVPD